MDEILFDLILYGDSHLRILRLSQGQIGALEQCSDWNSRSRRKRVGGTRYAAAGGRDVVKPLGGVHREDLTNCC